MGQTRVDLLHLLEDLRDAYPGDLEETILTEVVANSLDSGASRLSILTDPAERTVVVADNGSGMARRELSRCQMAQTGDIVIACGKGHEQSMCFGTVEYPWDDRIAMRAALAELLGMPGPARPHLPTG